MLWLLVSQNNNASQRFFTFQHHHTILSFFMVLFCKPPLQSSPNLLLPQIGTGIYTVLCMEQTTNENLLFSTGSFSQCSVVTSMRRKSKNKGIYTYVQLTQFAVQQKLLEHSKATPIPIKYLLLLCQYFYINDAYLNIGL